MLRIAEGGERWIDPLKRLDFPGLECVWQWYGKRLASADAGRFAFLR